MLLGFYTEQTPVPNQEIELQFAGVTMVSSDTEEVIQAIKQQLQSIGVTNIQVRQQADNTLKIAYYSNENVAAIKAFLIENGVASNNGFPEEPTGDETFSFEAYANVDSYKLDVYELQTAADSSLGEHQGKYILDLQKEYDKSPSPNSFANTSSFFSGDFNTTSIELTYTESGYIVIFKENISYEIPDVRAGPFTATLS